MATYHGNDGIVEFGANAVAEITDFEHTNTVDLAEDSSAGDEFKTRKPGKKDGSGKIAYRYDPTDANGQASVDVGDQITLTMYPSGNQTSNGKLTGTVIVSDMGVQSNQDDIVSGSLSYVGYVPFGQVLV